MFFLCVILLFVDSWLSIDDRLVLIVVGLSMGISMWIEISVLWLKYVLYCYELVSSLLLKFRNLSMFWLIGLGFMDGVNRLVCVIGDSGVLFDSVLMCSFSVCVFVGVFSISLLFVVGVMLLLLCSVMCSV